VTEWPRAWNNLDELELGTSVYSCKIEYKLLLL